MIVRNARPSDLDQVLALIRELEESSPFDVTVSVNDLQRDFFCDQPKAHMTVADHDGAVVGYTICNLRYSSRIGSFRMYMADLCVTQCHRGQGVGKALVRDLMQRCESNGYAQLDWNTLAGEPANDFYVAIGGEPRPDMLTYRSTPEMRAKLNPYPSEERAPS